MSIDDLLLVEEAPAPTVEPAGAETLALVELERSLSPLRRMLAYASKPGSDAKYVEANGRRWVEKALQADLLDVVREHLTVVRDRLIGVDALDADARHDALVEAHGHLSRVDALLGLPLEAPPPTRKAPKPPPAAPAVADEPSPDAPAGRKNRGKGEERGRGAERAGRKSDARPSAKAEPPKAQPAEPDPFDDALLVDDDALLVEEGEEAPSERSGRRRRRDRKKRGRDEATSEARPEPAGKDDGPRADKKSLATKIPDELDLDDLLEVEGEDEDDDGLDDTRGPFSLGRGPLGEPLAELLGADLAAAAAAAGLSTPTDLLLRPPVGYEGFRPVHGAGRPLPDGRVAIGGRVRHRLTRLSPGGARATVLVVKGAGEAIVEGGPWFPAIGSATLAPDARLVVVGDHVGGEGVQRLTGAEMAFEGGTQAVHLPRYNVDGVPDAALRAAAARITLFEGGLRESLPKEILQANDLLPLDQALLAVHTGSEQRDDGRRRLAFDELVHATLGLAFSRPRDASTGRGMPHTLSHALEGRIDVLREAPLDDPHQFALEQIKRDLLKSRAMRRVLLGRPGDHREMVALHAMVLVATSKTQVVAVYPDAAHAEAAYVFHEALLKELGLVARIITDEPSRNLLDALRRGEVHVVYTTARGTSAGLEFRRLGLVVAFESAPGATEIHKLIPPKGAAPDVLVVPLVEAAPGHLLDTWADYDVTRVPVATWPTLKAKVVRAPERELAYQDLGATLTSGAQALIALPTGRTGDLLSAEETIRLRTTLETHLPGAKILAYHGSLPREERLRRYQDFQRRRVHALLATHMAEGGPPVPGLTEVLIEEADRIGAERLTAILSRVAGVPDGNARLIVGSEPDPAGLAVVEQIAAGRLDEALAPVPHVPAVPRLRWVDLGTSQALLLAGHAAGRKVFATEPTLRRGPAGDLANTMKAWWVRLFDGPDPIRVDEPNRRRRRRRRRR
jgi:RecG-like helicase